MAIQVYAIIQKNEGQLTNAIEQYTNFKQSSDRKLLQWRARTILIRQFKYCLSNF